jgi:hypothetical protein
MGWPHPNAAELGFRVGRALLVEVGGEQRLAVRSALGFPF